MYEVELKVESAHGPVRERLRAVDAEPKGAVYQHDTYFDHPDRSFADADEALRLRREWPAVAGADHDGEPPTPAGPAHAATLTYKGPRIDDVSKTRREVETGVADPGAMEDLLRAVGFEPTASVEKVRDRFELAGYAIALDRVIGLGEFVEVEADAEESAVDERRDGAFDLLGRLGLDPAGVTRASYLGMLLGDGDY